jgi:WD40-like Beta Propeller Repeat
MARDVARDRSVLSPSSPSESRRLQESVEQRHHGAQLGEKREWIWIRDPGASTWRKLIPGRCPQWQLDGKRFYYFLDVGYDGSRAELWSADADGEARVRLTQSDYFINDGPVAVSPDGDSLAFVYRTSRASGDFQDVVVVDFRPSPLKPTDGRVVLRTRSSVDAHTLIWKGVGRLSVKVDGGV